MKLLICHHGLHEKRNWNIDLCGVFNHECLTDMLQALNYDWKEIEDFIL